jgi:hypothetical protein
MKINDIPNIILRFLPIFSTFGYFLYSYYTDNNNKIKSNEEYKNIIPKNTKITKKIYNKIYKTIYFESNLDKDPYNRKLDKKVVKKFCEIAITLNIKDDTEITSKLFDEIYKKYLEYQLSTLD